MKIKSFLIFYLLLAITLLGCNSQETEKEINKISNENLSKAQNVETDVDFEIEEYDFSKIVNGKDYIVYNLSQTLCDLLIFDDKSFNLTTVNFDNLEVVSETKFNMINDFEIVKVYPEGVFLNEKVTAENTNFIFMSFENEKRYILQQNEVSFPFITKIRDNYFYSGSSMNSDSEMKISLFKFNIINDKIEELISYNFSDDGEHMNGTRITAFGTAYENDVDSNSNPNYLYYQLVELKDQKSTEPIFDRFSVVKYDYVKKEIANSWIIDEPFDKMWGFNKENEDYVFYSEYADENPLKDITKLVNLNSLDGVLFEGINTGMEINELIPLDFSKNIFIAANISKVYILDFINKTVTPITSNFDDGIGKIMVNKNENYYNFGFEKYGSEGKKFLVYRMNSHYSDSENFNTLDYKYSYPTSRIVIFHTSSEKIYYLEIRENVKGQIQASEGTIWSKKISDNSFEKLDEFSFFEYQEVDEDEISIIIDGELKKFD